jgi:hypothetical protein
MKLLYIAQANKHRMNSFQFFKRARILVVLMFFAALSNGQKPESQSVWLSLAIIPWAGKITNAITSPSTKAQVALVVGSGWWVFGKPKMAMKLLYPLI